MKKDCEKADPAGQLFHYLHLLNKKEEIQTKPFIKATKPIL